MGSLKKDSQETSLHKHWKFRKGMLKYSNIAQLLQDACVVTGGILPVNAHAEANIFNLNYINTFIFYSSSTRLSNNVHSN